MSERTEPFVSIVTPVYNGEKYLAECIESVLSQTYKNWEYLIVDNKSTDQSLGIAREYAGKDGRIRVHVNEQNLPMIQNWNYAMRQISATSKYCKVVHADDWLYPECVARMVSVAEEHPSVGVVGSYVLEDTKVRFAGLPYHRSVVPGREICRVTLLEGRFFFGAPSTTLIRSDLIRRRHAFYTEDHLSCDIEAYYDILRDSDFGFVHQVLTYTRLHPKSQTAYHQTIFPYIDGQLSILKRYGAAYLNEKEYAQCLRRTLEGHYALLGVCLFQRRGKDFWDYQRKSLKKFGYSLNLMSLIRGTLLYFVKRPLDACYYLFNYLYSRRQQGS
jgi:glycosyltransferase involved in cell wall biosynthesis